MTSYKYLALDAYPLSNAAVRGRNFSGGDAQMTLTLDLSPAQETILQNEDSKIGVSVNELVSRTIAEKFPMEMDEDALALRLMEQWISEAPTDPEEVKEAEEDLRQFQRAINETRRGAGARILFPDVK